MASLTVPTPQDRRLLLLDTTSKTASYNSPALDLGEGTAPGGIGRPMSAVIAIVSRDASSGDETYAFVLQESSDGATFTPCGGSASVSNVGVMLAKGVVKKRYVRLALTVGGTTPAITYKAWLNPLP